MGGENPSAVLYDVNGNALAVQNATAIPASTPALLFAGSDGANSRYVLLDSSGRIIVVGAGTAGSPAGGVVSIQGVASGTAIPISGSVSITGTVGVTQSTSPWADNITQFGGTNISTGTGASGLGIPRVTVSNDSNILATQSGTWTVQQGSPPWSVSQSGAWTVTATQPTAANLNATVVGLGTPANPSGGILSTQVPDSTASGVLNALNTAVTLTLAGTHGAGMQLSAGTLQGTIVPEISFDAGNTWVASFFVDPSTSNVVASIVFASNNTATARTFVVPEGASSVRVRVSAFTSGTANCAVRSSVIVEPHALFAGAASAIAPPSVIQIGGTDGSNLRAMLTDASGHPIIVGDGVAGTPAGGVVSIQGVAGGTTVPVSGTVSISGTVGVTQSTSPWVDNISQFGGNNVVTGTGASGVGIPRVTVSNDSNILATQSGSWTVTANQGTPNTLANKWPVQVTDGTNVMPTADVAARAQFDKITDGTNIAAVKAASTAAVAADPALVVAISPNNTVAVTQSTSPWVANVSQFGGNNVVTGTGASGVGIPRVTVSNDSNILATQSGTWTVAQGAPNTQANKWPVQVTDGTHNMPTMDAIARAGFQEITDGTNGPVAVKASTTPPALVDPALVVVISPNQQPIPVEAAPSNATTGVSFGRVTYGNTSNTFTAIRATAYTEQTTNFTGSVKSTSANDAAAGTGARTVTITYYDQTGAGPNTETVTLNGTTAVNLVNTNHCFIEKMVVVTVGSGATNAGTISLFTGAGGTGTTVGSIGVATLATGRGDNTTLWAHHYTPTGKTTSIYLINAGTTGNQNADISLYSIPVLTANAAEVKISDSLVSGANSDSISRQSANPIKITGFARTTMYVVSAGANQPYSGGFDYSDQ